MTYDSLSDLDVFRLFINFFTHLVFWHFEVFTGIFGLLALKLSYVGHICHEDGISAPNLNSLGRPEKLSDGKKAIYSIKLSVINYCETRD